MKQKHPSQNSARANCPLATMSFTEIVRYLQGGEEAREHRRIEAHVRECRYCQEDLATVELLQSSGQHFLDTFSGLVEPPASAGHLDDVTLGAYLDKGLSETEQAAAAQHLSQCHYCYRQLRELEKELAAGAGKALDLPREFLTPEIAPEPEPFPAADQSSPSRWKNLNTAISRLFQRLWELRWPVPATAFALGMLLMLLLMPGQEKTVRQFLLLPGGGATEENLHQQFGASGNLPDEFSGNVLEIPYRPTNEAVVFIWPRAEAGAVDSVFIYQFDEGGERILLKEAGAASRAALSGAAFTAQQNYKILVVRQHPQQGVQVVLEQRFRFGVDMSLSK